MTEDEKLDQVRAEQAWEIVKQNGDQDAALIAARLAREGWTPPPPEPVDPDLAEAADFYKALCDLNYNGAETFFLNAIKRGRALAAAEAQPGMVWVKHDQTKACPVTNSIVTVRFHKGHYETGRSCLFDWWRVSHYAIITQPTDDAA